jgi:hypothetical protein
MAPVYMARGLADGPHKELPAEAERRRLIAAVARRPAALAPRAYGPLAI